MEGVDRGRGYGDKGRKRWWRGWGAEVEGAGSGDGGGGIGGGSLERLGREIDFL